MFWDIIFYGLIAVTLIIVVAVTYYRIDWARHPEKYEKDWEEFQKQEQKEEKKRQKAQKKKKR